MRVRGQPTRPNTRPRSLNRRLLIALSAALVLGACATEARVGGEALSDEAEAIPFEFLFESVDSVLLIPGSDRGFRTISGFARLGDKIAVSDADQGVVRVFDLDGSEWKVLGPVNPGAGTGAGAVPTLDRPGRILGLADVRLAVLDRGLLEVRFFMRDGSPVGGFPIRGEYAGDLLATESGDLVVMAIDVMTFASSPRAGEVMPQSALGAHGFPLVAHRYSPHGEWIRSSGNWDIAPMPYASPVPGVRGALRGDSLLIWARVTRPELHFETGLFADTGLGEAEGVRGPAGNNRQTIASFPIPDLPSAADWHTLDTWIANQSLLLDVFDLDPGILVRFVVESRAGGGRFYSYVLLPSDTTARPQRTEPVPLAIRGAEGAYVWSIDLEPNGSALVRRFRIRGSDRVVNE